MVWQLHEAKQNLSQVIRRAVADELQVITKHGKEIVVVLSVEEFQKLRSKLDFKTFLTSGPDLPQLEVKR